MLSPKKVKYRKQQKGRMRGTAQRGHTLVFGDFALKAVECGMLTAQQLEAARITISRTVKRGGQMWIRIFPDKSITKKPAETRMGSGKGSPELWAAIVRPGRILYELGGVEGEIAVKALLMAADKLPFATKIISRTNTL